MFSSYNLARLLNPVNILAVKRSLCIAIAISFAMTGLATAASEQAAADSPAAGLPGPTGLSCGSGTGSFTLSWNSVEEAAKYQVLIGDVALEETTGTSLGLGWLPANTRFEFGVRAGDGTVWGTTAAKVCATPSTSNGGASGQASLVDPPPLNTFFCTSSTHDSITASWQAVAGASSYRLSAGERIDSFTSREVSTVTTTGTSAILTGLTLNTTYIVAVRSINSEGQEGLGIGMICSTVDLVVDDLMCVDGSATDSTFSVSWTPSPHATVHRVSLDGGNWTTPDSSTGHEFSDLEEGGSYLVAVQGGNGTLWDEIESVSCETLPDAPVVSCADELATTTSFTANWAAVTGASKYRANRDDGTWNETTATSHAFTELTAGRSHEVDVQAGNSGGWSASGENTCETLPDAPVVSCANELATTTSFTANWAAVTGASKYRANRDDGTWNETTATSHAFTELTAGGSYEVDVQAGNSGGWSASGENTCETLPDAPVVSCADELATTTSFTASWAAVTGASKYRVNRDDGTWNETTATSHAFTELTAGGSHEVDVQAGNSGGWSASGENTCHTKPDAPVVTCSAATTTSFTANWAAVDGAEEYRARRVGSTSWDTTTATSATFSSLDAGGDYPVEVQARNGDIWSDSGTKTCHTKPDTPVIACSAETTTSFTASWAAIDGAEEYRARIDSGTWNESTATSHKFSGLSSGESFAVEVQARNGDVWSDSGTKTCHTLSPLPPPLPNPPVPPSNLACSNALTSGFTAGWDAVSGASGYRVRVDSGDWLTPDTTTSHGFADLGSGGEFAVEVQAGNSGGWSSSASVTCHTLPDAPAVSCSAATTSGFTANWGAVDGADSYRARVDEGDWAAVSETSHAFSDLGSGGEFAVEVQANNGGLWGASGTQTCYTLPNAPAVSCSAATTSGFTANWDAVDGADNYRARVDEGDWATVSGTSHAFADLGTGGEFAVEVQASNGGLWGASGTQTCYTLPDAPAVSCSAATASGFTANWDAVDGSDNYRARVDEGDWADVSGTSHVFSELAADTGYGVEVQAGNGGGWGAGGSVSCHTLLGAPAVSCVAGSATVSGFSASWTSVDGAAKYRARIDGGEWAVASGTGHVFSGLSPGGSHEVEVQAGKDGGWGATGAATCLTLPGAPGGLRCSSLATSVSVSWEAAENVTGYRARIDDGAWATVSGSAHTFTGLAVHSDHEVEVQAHNQAGRGPVGSIGCTTVPGGLACAATTATSVEVVFGPEPAATANWWVEVGAVSPLTGTVITSVVSQVNLHGAQSERRSFLPSAPTHRVRVAWTDGLDGPVVYETHAVCAVAGTGPTASCSASYDVAAEWAAVPGPDMAYRAAVELVGAPIAGPPARPFDPDGTTHAATWTGTDSSLTAYSPWIGTHRITLEAKAGAGRWWPLGTAHTLCPDPAHQYRELYRLSGAALQNLSGALDAAPAQHSLAQFTAQRARHGATWPFGHPYMSWRTDGCPGGKDTWLPFLGTTVSFRDACDRHDFTIQNLWRIENEVDSTLDTWNTANASAADQRLLNDLNTTCDNAYPYNHTNRQRCRQQAFNIYNSIKPNHRTILPSPQPPPAQ